MIAGYVVTPDDWLWLLRAVQAEGEPRLGVARALVNLWALARSRGSKQTIATLVRNYSQPVNPKHAHGGEFDADPQNVSAKERRRVQASSREVFSPDVVRAVASALLSSFEDDVTDFAAPWVDATPKGYAPRGEPVAGRNRLWTRATGWKGYRVDKMRNSERIAAIRSMARALPAAERKQIDGALVAVLSKYPAVGDDGGLLDGVRVIRPGEPGYEEARANAAQPVEADLALANWLDRVYSAVSDRVNELGKGAASAAKDLGKGAGEILEEVEKPLSSLLWAGAAVMLVWWLAKE